MMVALDRHIHKYKKGNVLTIILYLKNPVLYSVKVNPKSYILNLALNNKTNNYVMTITIYLQVNNNYVFQRKSCDK